MLANHSTLADPRGESGGWVPETLQGNDGADWQTSGPRAVRRKVSGRGNGRNAEYIRTYLSPTSPGSAKTSMALPEFGRRTCPASSGAISVDQLPPPIPAGMATYCFPLAK
jgi:hypothetical protein